MKKILSLSLLLMTCLLFAQSPSKNFIKTKVYKVAYHGTETLASRDTLVNVTYFNGFGQPIQSIAVGAGGNGQDIVTPITYDNGRKTKSYLPYADPQQTTSSLSYRDNDALVNNLKGYYVSKFPSELSATNPNPYTEIFTEASPFERIQKTAAPGEAWKIRDGLADRSIKSDLFLNEPNDAVLRFKVNFFTENAAERTDTTSLACVGYYGPNTLTKKIIRNENWNGDYNNHDNTIEEYLDSEGRLVLKRVFNQNQRHDTYYVYDKFNNLSYVIPPLASDQIVTQSVIVNPNGVSLPWSRLVLVDDELAEEYNKALKEYNSPNVLAADLLDKYGATGGFSVVPDAQGNLTLSINIQTNNAMPYRTGAILDLKEIGQFPDKEIGKITVDKHDYVFYVSSNQLFVKGDGKVKVPSISVSLTSGPKLSYSKNYNWTQIMNISDEQVDKYEPLLKDIPNDEQNITLVENEFGAVGGITLNIDDQDNVEFFLNFNSIEGLSLKEGSIFPLDISRKITDRSLGELKTADYSYRFFIKDNFFIIEGKGKLNNINFSANKPFTRYFINQESLDGLCYIHHYDSRNRQIEKHIPGKGWTQTVYDKLNRPVLVQDENLRAKTSLNWLYTKYDVFNRVVYSGEYTDARNRRDIQAALDSASLPLNEDRIASNDGIGITENTVLYTNNAFPTVSNISSVNYYDDYTFVVGKGNTMPTSNSYGETITANAKGMATCSKVLTLGTNNWESTVFYYEDRGLLVSTQSSNQYLSTSDLTEQDINFAGQILAAKRKHTKGSTTLIVEDLYTYNQVGQVLKQTEKINGGTEQLIVYNKYNELGTLVEKKVGGTPAATYDAVTGHLQKVKYAYSIRGWLKSINNPDTSLSSTADNDLFAFKVNYNTTDLSGSEALYNGNISETIWRSKTDDKKRGYSYHYDALNRLTDANYVGNYTMAQYPGQVENYTEGAIRYDKQGNIIHLERYGLKVNTIDKIDDLSYTYMPFSNKLVSVSDAASTAGFNNASTENLQDYNYDLNGNLISDANKRITRITYNYLDLPVSVQKSSSIYINYTYNAAGGKIEKKYNDGVNVTTTQYANGFVYQNGVLQYFPHAEGYVQKNSNGSFTYIYQYKDHLGNVRLSYFKNSSGALEVVEEENYYAFGMKHRGYNSITSSNANNLAQKIEFNGKEFQDELNLNWYDYGARNYDPTVGRWFNIDPLAEKYRKWTPYNYCMNNPVYFIDPDGMSSSANESNDFDHLGRARRDRYGMFIPMGERGPDKATAADLREFFEIINLGRQGGGDSDGNGDNNSEKSKTGKSWFGRLWDSMFGRRDLKVTLTAPERSVSDEEIAKMIAEDNAITHGPSVIDIWMKEHFVFEASTSTKVGTYVDVGISHFDKFAIGTYLEQGTKITASDTGLLSVDFQKFKTEKYVFGVDIDGVGASAVYEPRTNTNTNSFGIGPVNVEITDNHKSPKEIFFGVGVSGSVGFVFGVEAGIKTGFKFKL